MINLHIDGSAENLSVLKQILYSLADSFEDTLKILPFLFLAFLIIELLEHKSQEKINKLFAGEKKTGPLLGAVLGCIPQCGFSVMSANLYAGGIISVGTLIAVFLSTSDEAVILLASNPNAVKEIAKLLVCKILIAVFAGYLVDIFLKRKGLLKNSGKIEDLCDHEHCGCHEHGGILRPAIIHTVKVFGFLLIFTVIINLVISIFGTETLSKVLLSNSIFQPFLAGLAGFIPNCAPSVLLTQLYLEGAISFGSVVSGLCTGAGAGLLVLFRENRSKKDNLKIVIIMYVVAVISGMLLNIFNLLFTF